MIRLSTLVCIILFINWQAFGWGKTGHRVIGKIAAEYLSKKAEKKVTAILRGETLAMAGNYMDEIRSEPDYKFLDPWHYCSIPEGLTYKEAGTPEEGDIIMALERLTGELRTKNFTLGDETFTLKLLIHLIGDIHQPLHVGNGLDRGGNDLKVEYFWEPSNLHRVWDSGIIDGQQLSYTEYSEWINHPDEEQVKEWQASGIMDWAMESAGYRDQVYDLPENKKINYRYDYDNISLINKRLLQAGIRMAGILNDIYG